MGRLLESKSKVDLVHEKLEERMAVRSVLHERPTPGRNYPANQPVMYHFKPHLPISRREIATLWDLHKNSLAEDPRVEGMKKNYNQARLVLLIDQQGSMEPFSLVVEVLKKSVSRGNLVNKPNLYYFHDCPEGFLYKQPSLAVALPLEEVFAEQARGTSVLIVSDAGAARGYYDRRRVADTSAFLKILKTYTGLCTWLNPMPINRWVATTANDIRHMVPMFHLDRKGLNDAIRVLIGHPLPPGVRLNE